MSNLEQQLSALHGFLRDLYPGASFTTIKTIGLSLGLSDDTIVRQPNGYDLSEQKRLRLVQRIQNKIEYLEQLTVNNISTITQSNTSNSLPNLIIHFEDFCHYMEEVIGKFKEKHSVQHLDLQPVVFGSSCHGNKFDEESVSDIEVVTIFDAPSQDAWYSGVAGMGQTAIRDAELAAEYEGISLFDRHCCFVEVIKTPCENSFKNISYSKEEREDWINLLLMQLRLFPKLRVVRILCCSKNVKLLCNKLGISSEKGKWHPTPLFPNVLFIIFTHPSPYLAAFNPASVNERMTFAKNNNITPEDIVEVQENGFKFLHFYNTSYNPTYFQKLVKTDVIPNRDNQKTASKQKCDKKQSLQLRSIYQQMKQERLLDDQGVLLTKIKEEVEDIKLVHEFCDSYVEKFENFVKKDTEYVMKTEYNEYIEGRPGHCQYDSILLLINERDRNLREEVATFISQNAEEFSSFIDGHDLDSVLRDIRGDGWGDNLTLVAISHILKKRIRVCYGNTWDDHLINDDIYPDGEELVLGYINGNHYLPLFRANNIPDNSLIVDTSNGPPQSLVIKDGSIKSAEILSVKKEEPNHVVDTVEEQPPLEIKESSIKSAETLSVKKEEPNHAVDTVEEQPPLEEMQSLDKSNKVFFTNLPFSASWRDLKKIFEEKGYKVKYVCIFSNKEKKSLGMGYVEFENPEDTAKSIKEMNGTNVGYRKIKIAPFEPKEKKEKKKKIIEDKTFGLKNKSKSKSGQTYVKSVANTVNQVHDKRVKKEMEEKEQKRLEKKREQELKKEAPKPKNKNKKQ